MADSNKVVIKINYQGREKQAQSISEPKLIKEWNVKRIVTVVALLIFIGVLSFYFLSGASDVSESQNGIAEQKLLFNPTINIKPVSDNKTLKTIDSEKVEKKQIEQSKIAVVKASEAKSNIAINSDDNIHKTIEPSKALKDPRVARALLTRGINNKEPLDEISSFITVNKDKAAGVFYFTELIDMKEQVISHHWLWNNKLIYQKRFKIFGDRWRIATSKIIPYSTAGLWSARLVNEKGDLLNEINFQVIKE